MVMNCIADLKVLQHCCFRCQLQLSAASWTYMWWYMNQGYSWLASAWQLTQKLLRQSPHYEVATVSEKSCPQKLSKYFRDLTTNLSLSQILQDMFLFWKGIHWLPWVLALWVVLQQRMSTMWPPEAGQRSTGTEYWAAAKMPGEYLKKKPFRIFFFKTIPIEKKHGGS